MESGSPQWKRSVNSDCYPIFNLLVINKSTIPTSIILLPDIPLQLLSLQGHCLFKPDSERSDYILIKWSDNWFRCSDIAQAGLKGMILTEEILGCGWKNNIKQDVNGCQRMYWGIRGRALGVDACDKRRRMVTHQTPRQFGQSHNSAFQSVWNTFVQL